MLTIERRCRGVLPHYFDQGVLWATRGNRLLRTDDLGLTFEPVARLGDGSVRVISRARSLDRFAHVSPFVVVPLADGALAFSGRTVSRWRRGTVSFVPLDSPIDFRPMRRGVCVTRDGGVYVGEYRDNGGEHPTTTRERVRIWHFDGASWTVAWVFPEGTVRHVHAIVADPSRAGSFFVCTGDTDAESVIWHTTDDFGSLTPWRSAGQQTRTCDLVFAHDAVLWGIDSPLETSGICRWTATNGVAERLCDTPGPVYYGGCNEAGHVWFGSSVEPGPAVTSDRVHLFASRDGARSFADVFSRRADRSPQLSCLLFPRGTAPGSAVVFSLRATWRWEGQMVVGRLGAR